MATSRTFFKETKHRFLPTQSTNSVVTDSIYDLDESEIWNCGVLSSSPEFRVLSPLNSTIRRIDGGAAGVNASSLPVNVPEWSKIVKLRDNRESEYEYNDDGDRVPPHEYIARQMAKRRMGCASFSVHEGVGRTLKGRDLSRVRNAIWEITGFQD